MDQGEIEGNERLPPRVGDRLAAVRKEQGLSLDDVVQRTRVPRRHLEMIEAGNYGALPALPYSAGFVKTYAQMLGLDGAALSRDFRAEVGQVEQVRNTPAPFEPADPARMPSRLLAFVALAVAVLLAAGYALWRGAGMNADERASLAAGTSVEQAAPPVAPKSAPPPAATAPAPAAGPVTVTATQPVWVKIYERGGPTLFQGEMAVGQRFALPESAFDPLIWTGRPQAIQVSVGARALPPLGQPDRTIKDVSLKRDALLARLAPPATPPLTPAPAAPAPIPTPGPAPAPITPVDPVPPPAQP